jgi:hypothetical protein
MWRWLFAGLVLLGVAGCPGSLENPDRFAGVSCTLTIDVERDIFQAKCSGGTCHGAGAMPAGNLDLESPDVLSRLVGVSGQGCNGRALIQTEAPDGSAILDRLAEEPECGLRMPLGSDPLPPEEVDCVRAYVFEAANGGTTQ